MYRNEKEIVMEILDMEFEEYGYEPEEKEDENEVYLCENDCD